MQELANKRVLVVGLGASGRAASELLRRRGAKVLAIDRADTPPLRREADALRALGVEVRLGITDAPADALDLAVVSPGVPTRSPLVEELLRRSPPTRDMLGENGEEGAHAVVPVANASPRQHVGHAPLDVVRESLEELRFYRTALFRET